MFSTRALGVAGTAAAFLALTPALAATADDDHELDDHGRDGPVLEGRAVLDAETYAPGPPSGAFFAGQTINGVTFPNPSQPAIGYSGIVAGRSPGEFLAMPDNGFGNKLNSFDFELRAYYITPDFKTANGGTGEVEIDFDDYVAFRDPNNEAGFDIVRKDTPERLLTGADFDPESIQRGHDGDLWLGDEFGPWILHFSADGVLLDPPIALPDGLMSPANPHLVGPATIAGSRGLEGMAISPNGKTLTFILEGAVVGAADPFSRRIYEYEIGSDAPPVHVANYRTEVAGHFVADVQALDDHRLIVIERDGGRGLTANFRRVYEVDLNSTGADGAVLKTQVVDLAQIPDPDLVSLPALHTGDVGLGDPFRVTCESIEALHVISHARLLLGCDNNFPNTGRNPNLADDSEFIVVKVPGL
jgi:glycerophosphoryl diester phosphodiesterase